MADLCKSCGVELYPGARFCQQCGAPVAPPQPAPPEPPETERLDQQQWAAQPEQQQWAAQPEQQPWAAQPEQQPWAAQPEQQPWAAQPEQQPWAAQPEQQPWAQPEQQQWAAQPEQQQWAAQPEQQPWAAPGQPAPGSYGYAPSQPPAKKSKAGLIAGIIAGVVVIAGVAAGVLAMTGALGGKGEKTPAEESSRGSFSSLLDPATQPASSDMENLGVSFDLSAGKKTAYKTHGENGDLYTGTMTVEKAEIKPVDQSVLAFAGENGWGDLSGYVRARVTFQGVFPLDEDDEDGPVITSLTQNFYDIEQWLDSARERTDSEGVTYMEYTVTFRGKEQKVYLYNEYDFEDDGDLIFTDIYTILMPEGYDGVVLGYRDSGDNTANELSFQEAWEAGSVYHLFRVQ